MKKINIFLILVFSIFISGCLRDTTALTHFKKTNLNANAVQYTKKRDLINNSSAKAMLFVTYLNKIDEKYNSEDNKTLFLVGTHFIDKSDHDYSKNGYILTINNKEPENIKEVDNNSILVRQIPLKDLWGKYYLITLENQENVSSFNIKLSNIKLGQTQIDFLK